MHIRAMFSQSVGSVKGVDLDGSAMQNTTYTRGRGIINTTIEDTFWVLNS